MHPGKGKEGKGSSGRLRSRLLRSWRTPIPSSRKKKRRPPPGEREKGQLPRPLDEGCSVPEEKESRPGREEKKGKERFSFLLGALFGP